MAVTRLRFLSKNEEEIVHAQSVKSLETIGVKIPSDSVLHMLKDAGAIVDMKTQIA